MNLLLLSIIVVIYLLVISYLGWLGYRSTKTTEDYLIAGRGVHPYIMALSYGATFISTSAIIGFGGVSGLFGLSLLWLTFLNIFVGIFIAFVFFGKRTRRLSHHLGAHTLPELLGFRYKSKFVQVATGFIILTMVVYAAAVLIGAGRHLEGIINISFDVALFVIVLIVTAYVIAGGLKGVMYTDALQGTIMFFGMILLLVITLSHVGGLSQGHKKLARDYQTVLTKEHLQQKVMAKAQEHELGLNDQQAMALAGKYMKTMGQLKKLKAGITDPEKLKAKAAALFDQIRIDGVETRSGDYNKIFKEVKAYVLQYFILNKLNKGGHRGWDKMPEGGTPIWWLIVSSIVLGVGIGVLAQPQLAVRFMTVNSDRELNRSVLVGAIFILLMTGGSFVVGSLSNAFFFETHDGAVAIGLAGGNVDKIMPLFLRESMPQWFNYIFLLTLLSAAMSTLSSQFHAMGTSISRDIIEAMGWVRSSEAHSRRGMFIVKLGVAVMIVITVILGFSLPGGIIAAATAIFFGICAAAFLPSLVGALYWKKATRAGAIASIISGFAVSLFWLLLVHSNTVKKLGSESILKGSTWAHVDPILIGLPLSALVFIGVSLVTRPLPQEHVDHCYESFTS